ncbi:MAG: hypothetical protein LBF83_01620 [Spirochaetaceae bacterium]|nr:hypothetical protein [Spirochaetaceae bacterium]
MYFVIFVLLAVVQFNRPGNLNRQIGALRINGSIRRQSGGAQRQTDGAGREYLVHDGVQLFFGGLEFRLSGSGDDGFAYVDSAGVVQAAYPEAITISGSEARFRLSGGQELSFYIDNNVYTKKLTVSALVKDGIEQILVPFNVYGRADIVRSRSDNFVVRYEGNEYILEAANVYKDRRLISLSRTDPAAFYGLISDGSIFNMSELIVSSSKETQIYNEIVQNWCGAAFGYWERTVNADNRTEDTVASYLAEAGRRGALAAAINRLPASFRNGTHTFLLAPFLGRLSNSTPGLLTNERENISRIASFSGSTLSGFLTEKDIFKYLYEHDSKELFDRGIEYIKSLDPSTINVKMCAGIFEGWLVWNKWIGEDGTENPFDKFLHRAGELVSTSIKKDKTTGYVSLIDGNIDTLYNIRLGAALTNFSEATGDSGWAAVGRSLIISMLSLTDSELSLNAELELSVDGSFINSASSEKLTAAQIYRELKFSNFYPHAFGTGKMAGGVWCWTISPEISATFQNNVLDLGVNFPPGETHYLYILNVKPFFRVQMRNMDWRSDPQFEQYNAPGWRYSPSEQVLMVKIVQLSMTEHIRIVF